MYEILKPEVHKLTRKLAQEFAEMAVATDRPLSNDRTSKFRKIVENGQLRNLLWAKYWCEDLKKWLRVSGQHTSTFFTTYEPLPDVFVTIEQYRGSGVEDGVKLFATYDSRQSAKTTGDINSQFQGITPELANVSRRVVNTCVSAFAYAKYQDAYTKIPAAERAEAMLDNVQFIQWLDGLITSSAAEDQLRRSSVVAAMYLTWKKSQKAASDFWTLVRDETGSVPTSPDRMIAKFLNTISIDSGHGARAGAMRKACPREFFVKCIHAWNAWRRNATTDLKYFHNKDIPAIC
jgi:hypothetical protein